MSPQTIPEKHSIIQGTNYGKQESKYFVLVRYNFFFLVNLIFGNYQC